MELYLPEHISFIGEAAFDDVTTLYADSRTLTGKTLEAAGYSYSDTYQPLTIENGVVKACDPAATEVVVPYGVTKLYADAFEGCVNLTSVTLPDSLAEIGPRTFEDCAALESIVLPDNVSTISGKRPFPHTMTIYCRRGSVTAAALEANYRFHLYLDSDAENPLTIVDGVVVDCDPAAVSVVVPEGVTAIGEKAFFLCGRLTSVSLPSSVTEIRDSAFRYCTALKDVRLPEGVSTIGDGAFWACSALTSIDLPDSLTSIGDSAFCLCESLTSIVIPDSVTEIPDSAFHECFSLSSIA